MSSMNNQCPSTHSEYTHTHMNVYSIWGTEIEKAESSHHESRFVQLRPAEPVNRLFVWSSTEGYEKQPASPPGRASVCVCV